MLIQGGGTICATLTLTGGEITVEDCTTDCTLVLSTATIACETSTTGTDTYTVSIPFDNGASGAPGASGYTITTSGTIGGDNPMTAATGTVILTFTEGSSYDYSLQGIDGNANKDCNFNFNGISPSCNPPTCSITPGAIQESTLTYCGGDLIDFGASSSSFPSGYEVIYVLTSGGVIQDTSAISAFTAPTTLGTYGLHLLVYDPDPVSADYLDLNTITFGTTTAADVDATLVQGGGTICAALTMTPLNVDVIDCANPCNLPTPTVMIDSNPICQQGTGSPVNAILSSPDTPPTGYTYQWQINGINIMAASGGNNPTITTSTLGTYTLIFTDGAGCDSPSSNSIILESQDCTLACTAAAGTIATTDATTVCVGGSETITVTTTGGSAGNLAYVVTDGSGTTILDGPTANNVFSFAGAPAGTCQIWAVWYDDINIPDDQVANITGCFELSNPIDVTRSTDACNPTCTAAAGTIATTDATTVCVGGSETITVTTTGGSAGNLAYVVTDGSGTTILDGPTANNVFSFAGAPAGTCQIWAVWYDDINIPDDQVANITGCFELSNPIDVTRSTDACNPTCTAAAGTIATTDATTVCVGGSETITVTTTGGSAGNLAYVVTDGSGTTILDGPTANNVFSFAGAPAGTCQIWAVWYDDINIPDDQVANITGCFELSNPIDVTRSTAACNPTCNVATPSIISTVEQICMLGTGTPTNATLSATTTPPTGFSYQWLLNGVNISAGTGGIDPSITTSTVGTYSLIFTDGVGCESSASNAVAISMVNCTPSCNIATPTITVDSNPICNVGTGSPIVATFSTTDVPPAGYNYQWQINGININSTSGGNNPTLQTSTPGAYTLIFTNGAGCESSASVSIILMSQDCSSACNTTAGSLTASDATVCTTESIGAIHTVGPTTPFGYTTAYILTSGTGLAIIDINPSAPTFSGFVGR